MVYRLLPIRLFRLFQYCRWAFSSLTLCSVVFIASVSASAKQMEHHEKPISNEFLVRFKASLSSDAVRSKIHQQGALLYQYNARLNFYRITTPLFLEAEKLSVVFGGLKNDPEVEYIEPNAFRHLDVLPNDPLFVQQWGLDNIGQSGGTPGADIHAAELWDHITSSPNSIIAVLDTGIDYGHEDLFPNLWKNPGEDWAGLLPGHNGLDDDEDGYVDNYYGINILSHSGDPMDTVGHGTHVAGIIGAAGNNGQGIAGVNWKVQLLAIKFMSRDGGTVADEIEGITYLLERKERGAPIVAINASFGGDEYSLFEREAIAAAQAAGIIFIASAGNAATNSDGSGHYPSGYNLDNVISVAASDQNDRLASFSNFGVRSVDVAAPGVSILSTRPGEKYGRSSGTSMAAPHVTGLYALLQAALPEEGWVSLKHRVLAGSDPNEDLAGKVLTGGRVNAYQAFSLDFSAPRLYSLGPNEGHAGSQVRIVGTRFGSDQDSGFVNFPPGIQASIRSWSDSAIVCTVPQGVASGAVAVSTSHGNSDSRNFKLMPYRYCFSFASNKPPWISTLVLNNRLLDHSLEVKLFAVQSGTLSPNERGFTLQPAEQRYVSLDDLGIYEDHPFVWIETREPLGAVLVLLDPLVGGVAVLKPHLR
jgi:subtilisin family serine protease